MGFLDSLNFFGGKYGADINTKPQQYDYATGQLGSIAQQSAGRAAPQIAGTQLDPTQMGQSRGGLLDTASRLGAIASGQQAGAGELAVNRQLGSAYAQQLGAARAARGQNAVLAYRNAMRGNADMSLQGAGMAAQAQLADQQAANQQLGSIYGQMYGQDASVSQANAQLGQQAQMANQQATLQQTGMNDAARLQALGQMLGWDQTRIQAEIEKARINSQDRGMFGGLLQTAGQIGAAYATGGISGAKPPVG